MGQSHSAGGEQHDALKLLSEDDLQALRCMLQPEGNEVGTEKVYFDNLKSHLGKHLSPGLTEVVISTLQSRCRKTGSKMAVEHSLIAEITKFTYGGHEDLIEVMFEILKDPSGLVSTAQLKTFVYEIFKCFSAHPTTAILGITTESCDRFVDAQLTSSDEKLNVDQFATTLQNVSHFTEMCRLAFKIVFFNHSAVSRQDMHGFMPILIPSVEWTTKLTLNPNSSLLSLPDMMYLNNYLPLECQHKWRLLYSTNIQGESFSKLSSQIVDKGPLLIIVRDEAQNIFGGFISTNLKHSSQFQGNERCFTFRITPSYGLYLATGYNDNYAYLNTGQETIPNGLAMGGQHNYFGFWLSTEFGKGHSKAKPTSTTFGNPQLSAEEDFTIDGMEAWGVGNEPKPDEDEYEEQAKSVLDKNPDVVAMLRIAGKEPASEGYRESDNTTDRPETSDIHLPHDPMQYP